MSRRPAPRFVIEQRALDSTRADRFRAIVIEETASEVPTQAG
jgi:hypothetical protein